jgi:hypothetical protein
MNCLFCKTETTELNINVWKCFNCPHEVRFIGPEPICICIFVFHNNTRYVLNWGGNDRTFQVYKNESRLENFIVNTIIPTGNYIPDVITPINALTKLKTILTFL